MDVGSKAAQLVFFQTLCEESRQDGFQTGKFHQTLLLGIKPLLPAYLDPSLQPQDLLTGVNFASGAVGFDHLTYDLASVLSLRDQLALFKDYLTKLKSIAGEDRSSKFLQEYLVIMVAGSNDVPNTYFGTPLRRSHYDVPSYTELLVSYASSFVQVNDKQLQKLTVVFQTKILICFILLHPKDLYRLGARRIGLLSLPPIGCLPSQRTLRGGPDRNCVDEYNQVARLFNKKLCVALNSINRQFPEVRIVNIDIYNYFLDLIDNPQQYGPVRGLGATYLASWAFFEFGLLPFPFEAYLRLEPFELVTAILPADPESESDSQPESERTPLPRAAVLRLCPAVLTQQLHASPPSSADYSATYHQNSASYPTIPQTPDPLPTAPSYTQPQSADSFPQFEVHGTYQSPSQAQSSSYHRSYDQPASNYTPNLNPNPGSANSGYPSVHASPQYPQSNSTLYETPYDNRDVNFSRSRSDLGPELYGKRAESGYGEYGNDGVYGNNEGVYAYRGSSEPYGARGTAPKSSTWSGFDDFGRPIGYSSSSSGKERSSNSALKVVRAVPKADTQQDAKSGVQKFRVKLLAESGGQSTMDVLCQIGLDGIRMLDPSTNRILRIYLLDSITRCEAIESSTFAFWSKTPVDIEPRRIRLKSNSYTTNTLLDTVTAAIVQYKEMSGRSRAPEYPKTAEQPAEKKKGFGDFLNLIKPLNEEKDHWVPDEVVTKCTACGTDFSAFVRKHHCRNCGDIFCDKCTQGRTALTAEENAPVVRVCDRCLAEVSRRLGAAKEAASRSTVTQSHEDLAKKLQEEMERSCKVSSGSRSDSSGRRMKEVACPTCTVHLQVQVPSSGSETIECGVCQHPFLVTSH
ncbi:protein FREE1 [Sesamum alatum]|uniref:Protein FREE1 n=1 Tax=Sesamum alatum TaxID=300844 RepID=A0AAE2CPH1_9LAMI|nr:protein FREE1 [Sesamum alatum]